MQQPEIGDVARRKLRPTALVAVGRGARELAALLLQDALAKDLASLNVSVPKIPVVKNIDGTPTSSADEARTALIHQVTGAVQWVKSMQTLIASGVDTFIEVGPGKVLCGLMRQIDRGKTCINVEDEASLQKTISHVSS